MADDFPISSCFLSANSLFPPSIHYSRHPCSDAFPHEIAFNSFLDNIARIAEPDYLPNVGESVLLFIFFSCG